MKKIRTILIGYGKMGKGLGVKDKGSHFGALKNLKKKFLLLDIIYRKKKGLINSSLKKFHPNLVVICVSSQNHYNVCKQIFESDFKPKVIFLEKPCFQSRFELNEILKLSKKKNIKIIINQTYRFNKNSEKLKKKIKLNNLGKIRKISINYTNGFKNNSVHLIDLVYYLFGQNLNFKIIKSWKNIYTTDTNKKINYNFYMYDKKKKIILEGASFNKSVYEIFDINLFFEKGKISVENFFKSIFIQKINLDKFRNKELGNKKKFFKCIKDNPLINAYNRIYQYVKIGTNIRNFDLETNKKTMQTIFKVEKNA